MDPNYQPPQPAPQPEPAPAPTQPTPPPAPVAPPPPAAPAPPQYDFKHNPLSVMQDGEKVVCEIKRHPIGLVGMYISMSAGLLACIVAIILAMRYVPNLSSSIKTLMWFVFLIIVVVIALFAYVSRLIYKNNRWIVTDDSITQVSQVGLFRKQVSQLSLANLEDVTAEQNGVLESMFGFGTLRAETAGERSKFVFGYCPDPNGCARKILQAREEFIHNDPTGAKRANELLSTPQNLPGNA